MPEAGGENAGISIMMRIRKLELVRFGMFSDRSFNFGPRPENGSDIHIVYGANEAGKTTAMEGYLRLLYGFPLREPFAYFHDRSNLLVRGEVELNGRLRSVSRLPTRKNTLVDEFDTALRESLFQDVLQGLGVSEYRKLFCLNDETIEAGGNEIVSGQGDTGKLLFGAKAGISAVSEILDRISLQADSLYKKRGSKPRLPTLKREWEEISSQIRSADTTAAQFQSLRKNLDAAREEERSAKELRGQKATEKSRYEALASALPKLEAINELTEYLSGFDQYPNRINFEQDALQKINDQRVRLRFDRDRLKSSLETLAADLRSVQLDPERLGLLEELEVIEQSRSRYVTAMLDLPKREQELGDRLREMHRIALDIGAPEGTDPKSLALSAPGFSELSRKCSRLKDLSENAQREQREIDRLSELTAAAAIEIEDLRTAAPQGKKVSEILDRLAVSELESEYKFALGRTREAAATAERALRDLAVRGLKFKTVPAAALTPTEARKAAATLADGQKETERLRGNLSEIEQKLAKCASQIGALKADSGLVSDADAAELKTLRDEKWQQHKSALTSETADLFETAMRELDEASERRLALATSRGKLQQLEAQASAFEIERDATQKKLSRKESETAAQLQALDDISAGYGFEPPLSPEGLAEWLVKAEAARTALDEKSAVDDSCAELFAKTGELRDTLAEDMALEARSHNFAEIMSVAKEVAKGHSAHRQELASAEDRLKANLLDKRRRERILAGLQEQESGAAAGLELFISGTLGCSVDHSDLDSFRDALRELQKVEQSRIEIEHRVETMKADREAFRSAVSGLARRFGVPDLEDPLALFAELKKIGESARQASKNHKELVEENKRAESDLTGVSQRLEQLADQVRELASHFPPELGIKSLEDLREAVRITDEVIEKRQDLTRLEREIRTGLGVPSLEEARTTLAGLSLAEVTARLDESERDTDLADQAFQEAISRRSMAESKLQGVRGDNVIVDLVQKRRPLELRMREVAQEYLELRFGLRLAEEAIRRYSEKHRSGMLKATETAFSELTNGAYTRLRTQNEDGREVLVAIDSADSSKRAETMSKGTRFQLYLALRAAAYEQMASTGTILPFFCDDVFETFDEDRTRAACTLMDRIGRTGQAIYLTHHRHVVEIAEEVCSGNVCVHEL